MSTVGASNPESKNICARKDAPKPNTTNHPLARDDKSVKLRRIRTATDDVHGGMRDVVSRRSHGDYHGTAAQLKLSNVGAGLIWAGR